MLQNTLQCLLPLNFSNFLSQDMFYCGGSGCFEILVYCLETQTGWPALVTLLIRVVQFPLQQHLKAELE